MTSRGRHLGSGEALLVDLDWGCLGTFYAPVTRGAALASLSILQFTVGAVVAKPSAGAALHLAEEWLSGGDELDAQTAQEYLSGVELVDAGNDEELEPGPSGQQADREAVLERIAQLEAELTQACASEAAAKAAAAAAVSTTVPSNPTVRVGRHGAEQQLFEERGPSLTQADLTRLQRLAGPPPGNLCSIGSHSTSRDCIRRSREGGCRGRGSSTGFGSTNFDNSLRSSSTDASCTDAAKPVVVAKDARSTWQPGADDLPVVRRRGQRVRKQLRKRCERLHGSGHVPEDCPGSSSCGGGCTVERTAGTWDHSRSRRQGFDASLHREAGPFVGEQIVGPFRSSCSRGVVDSSWLKQHRDEGIFGQSSFRDRTGGIGRGEVGIGLASGVSQSQTLICTFL